MRRTRNPLHTLQDQRFEDGMYDIFETLTAYADIIEAHEDRFLPGVLEESQD